MRRSSVSPDSKSVASSGATRFLAVLVSRAPFGSPATTALRASVARLGLLASLVPFAPFASFTPLAPLAPSAPFAPLAGAASLACLSSWMASPAAAQTLTMNWQPLTLDQAIAEAEKSGKKVLVEVWAEHCEQCKVMDNEVWSTPNGIALASNAIPIKINSTSPEGAALSKRYPVLGLPLTLYLNEDGTEFDRVTGYDSAQSFFLEVTPISQGIDNLVQLEKRHAQSPDDATILYEIYEKLLSRKREAEAQQTLTKIFAADTKNGTTIGERAIGQAARYSTYYKGDHAGAFEQWKSVIQRYPNASSIGAAIDGAYKATTSMGRINDWKTWLCELTKSNPRNGMLQQSAALTAYRYKVYDPCFAAAARAAIALGMKAPNLQAVADAMEGK